MSLKFEDNNWIVGDMKIWNHVDAFFSNIFKSEGPQPLESALVGLSPIVSKVVNDELLQDFTMEDLKVAVHELGGLKIAGPYGFHGMFY
ncbi:hypothetical protein ACFX13_028366 [Malus domestica]